MKKPRLKPRNHVALNPLLAKCAVHGKSHKAQRQQKKIDLRRGRYDQSACVRACAVVRAPGQNVYRARSSVGRAAAF